MALVTRARGKICLCVRYGVREKGPPGILKFQIGNANILIVIPVNLFFNPPGHLTNSEVVY